MVHPSWVVGWLGARVVSRGRACCFAPAATVGAERARNGKPSTRHRPNHLTTQPPNNLDFPVLLRAGGGQQGALDGDRQEPHLVLVLLQRLGPLRGRLARLARRLL